MGASAENRTRAGLGIALGLLVLPALALLPGEPSSGSTYALFVPQALDLKLNGQDNVAAIVLAPNISPGDTASGSVWLTAQGLTGQTGMVNLSMATVVNATRGGSLAAAQALAGRLQITQLTYGAQDLLTPARLAPYNGTLTLAKLQTLSIARLPPPGPPGASTKLTLTVLLQPDVSNALQGLGADVTLRFTLYDSTGV